MSSLSQTRLIERIVGTLPFSLTLDCRPRKVLEVGTDLGGRLD